MNTPQITQRRTSFLVALTVVLLVFNATVWAHCDRMDGPVVVEAKAALKKGDVAPVLKWIPESDEAEIRKAFKQTLEVRKKGPTAKDLADRYFFETLVRIHRAYEGVAFTGLKSADEPLEPAIAKADQALENGSVDELAEQIAATVKADIKQQFEEAKQARASKDKSVEAGREFVKQFVQYIHYVERVHDAMTSHQEDGYSPEDSDS